MGRDSPIQTISLLVIIYAAFSYQRGDECRRYQARHRGIVLTDGVFGVRIFINRIVYEESREDKEGIA